jgi:hypothetical protein
MGIGLPNVLQEDILEDLVRYCPGGPTGEECL